MNRYLVLCVAAVATLAACSDKKNGPRELGPPANMAITAGSTTAPANTDLTGLTLVVRDANNQPLPNQTVTFAVISGGGSITTNTATTGDNGTLTVPTWRLGKIDVPQVLRATINSVTFDVTASVQTSYNIVLRFYGTQPTPAQQALFDTAAARIRATVTGDLAPVNSGSNFDISGCTPGQTTTISEVIDDVVIYVRLAAIDGPGKILASAGPCFVRSGKNAAGQGGADSLTTVIGTMQFDIADLGSLRRETILHEMLHVIGHGAMWPDPHPDGWGLVTGAGTPTPRYTGAEGRAGAQEVGCTVTCASSVPVEDTLGPGTADVHWEENVFDTELMTGFVENPASAMPMSKMTVRSLRDIGYTVNAANFDDYTKPFGALRGEGSTVSGVRTRWEGAPPVAVFAIDRNGRIVKQLRRRP
ncbi:MAG TPA: leishmanolysin-related zinc metalloendopeptidase [Gemmatimonadaceae bacterium]|nr:leishmanolysin-related zinc metalloendopeptidase [Gemmatimonadaceae bacterium]